MLSETSCISMFHCQHSHKVYILFCFHFTGELLQYLDLNCVMCSRSDVRKFAQEAKELGVNYIGLCCGNAPNLLREIAEVYGRKPPASKYAPDVQGNVAFKDDANKEWRDFIVG